MFGKMEKTVHPAGIDAMPEAVDGITPPDESEYCIATSHFICHFYSTERLIEIWIILGILQCCTDDIRTLMPGSSTEVYCRYSAIDFPVLLTGSSS